MKEQDLLSPAEKAARASVAKAQEDIVSEIGHQAKKFAHGSVAALHEVDDKENTPYHWVTYISKYVTSWFAGGFPVKNADFYRGFRTSMVKVGALAVSAICWTDRKLDGQN